MHVPVVLSPAPSGGTGSFRAGAAEVDVTPPAGLGTWGHGPDARASRGHRGRLRCRVIYLEDARGERVALVPCDFAAMDVHLVRTIAHEVDARVGLGADRLVMSATHTHGGPAHYFAARNYNGHFSGEVRGYDARFVAWVASRVAGAIESAYDTAVPARIAWTTRFVNRGDGSGSAIGQNRSLPAHCANDDPMHGGPSTCPSGTADPIAEVEGRLDLLRIDAVEGERTRPLALYASYPVHGTAVPNTNAFFEADLWGFASRYLEAKLRDRGGFVAALANGPEGDVRPSYTTQGWDEARRLGRLLGERIREAYEELATFEDDPHVTIAYRDVSLPSARAPGGDERLCEGAELGRSAPGGSEEGRTGRYGRRWHEGMRDARRRGCHRPADTFAFHRFASRGFPTVAPLALVGIGSGTVAAFPWEMTTTAGLRLRARLREALGTDGPVALVGLANEYVQYLTTPEEFAMQNYEGASTLYGSSSLAVLEGHFVELAGFVRASRAGAPAHVEMIAFDTARPLTRSLWYDTVHPIAPRIDEERSGATELEGHAAIAVRFLAGEPASLGTDGAVVARVERRDTNGAFVPAFDADGHPLDDTHEALLLEHLGRGRRLAREVQSASRDPEATDARDVYRVVWVPDPGTAPGDYRLVVIGAGVERAAPPVFFAGRP